MRRSKFLLADDDDSANAWFMRTAVFVDLPNFYSRLIKSGIGEPREMRDYFLQWLDLDLLSKWLTGQTCPTWVFYSGRRIGPSSERIEGQRLEEFIKRTNRLPSVTAYDVNIPGDQREPFTTKCECGKMVTGQWESEKGVDASLIVHLFDTADSWDEAILLSGDADFTPVVRSLRRRGKLVRGAGFAGASESLIREFYSFEDLSSSLVRNDFAAYLILGHQGLLDQWMAIEVPPTEVTSDRKVCTIECSWSSRRGRGEPIMHARGRATYGDEYEIITFNADGFNSAQSRFSILEEFYKRFPDLTLGRTALLVSPQAWDKVARILPDLLHRYHGYGSGVSGRIRKTYVFQNGKVTLKVE